MARISSQQRQALRSSQFALPAAKAKVAKTMHEWGEGKLHSGSKRGPVVTKQKQAVAIALSQASKANRK